MNLKRLKALQSSLLRGGICAIWVCGSLMAVYYCLVASTADMMSPEQREFVIRAAVCGGISLVAASGHAFLIKLALEMEE